VIFCVVESLNVPIAVNACTVCGAIVVVDGATTIDTMVALVTSSVTVPAIDPTVAVTVVEPTPDEAARPVVPTVAAAVFEDDQVACVVTLCRLPSL
jgi:hypothetical protein